MASANVQEADTMISKAHAVAPLFLAALANHYSILQLHGWMLFPVVLRWLLIGWWVGRSWWGFGCVPASIDYAVELERWLEEEDYVAGWRTSTSLCWWRP